MLSLEHQPTDRHQSSIRDNRFCLSPRTVPSEMVALSSQAFPKEWPSKRNGIRVATAESSVSGDKNNFFLVATSCSSLSFRLRTYSVPKRYHSLMYVGGVWCGVYISNPPSQVGNVFAKSLEGIQIPPEKLRQHQRG